MVSHLQTLLIRESVAHRASAALFALGRQTVRTLYHPTHGTVYAYNFGSRIRPEVAPLAVSASGTETVASFLSRGGRIVKVAPKVAKGAVLVDCVKSNPTRVRTSRG